MSEYAPNPNREGYNEHYNLEKKSETLKEEMLGQLSQGHEGKASRKGKKLLNAMTESASHVRAEAKRIEEDLPSVVAEAHQDMESELITRATNEELESWLGSAEKLESTLSVMTESVPDGVRGLIKSDLLSAQEKVSAYRGRVQAELDRRVLAQMEEFEKLD